MPVLLDARFRDRDAVAVGIPCTESIPRTAFHAFMFMAQTMKPRDHLLQIQQTAVVSEARNTLIKGFLELPDDVRYLLLFDSDMVVGQNIIDVMVSRKLPFLSAYCTRKTYPYLPIPAKASGQVMKDGELVTEYQPITNIELNSGIHRVDGVGAAAICVRRDVLEAIEPPWFKFEGGGEDYYFCRKVQEVVTSDMPDGVWIAVDSHIQVGHIGEAIAYPSDFINVKPQWMADTGNHEYEIGESQALLVS